MNYPVDIARLERLAATRAGRVALNGFEYQRAFAVLRLSAMALQQPVRGAGEVPVWLRYEWAEDIDEVCSDGTTVLWQCKHGDGWHTPSALADVLEGFAPKWLWTPADQRHRLHFRLVTSDAEFIAYSNAPGPLPSKPEVLTAFRKRLAAPFGNRADRAQWQTEADQVGHDTLFEALWAASRVLHIPAYTVPADRDVPWAAEQEAVVALCKGGLVANMGRRAGAVDALRALLSVHPIQIADANGEISRPSYEPQAILPLDLRPRLWDFAPALSGEHLHIVERTTLREWLVRPVAPPYIARRPEWADVVRGDDSQIRFFERTLTTDILKTLRTALQQSQHHRGRLQLQWIVGAPGAGKSTLTLRLAALLALESVCTVVDARHSLDLEDDPKSMIEALQRLAEVGRPVLLLLDDPLGANSGWPRLLRHLSRHAPAIVVLAATPDFLWDRHHAEIEEVQMLAPVELKRPDIQERQRLAELYPEADVRAISQSNEELLVLAMQAAAGASFDDIIRGIWRTLGDQRQVGAMALGSDLNWEQVAFYLVVFFHRAYASCPLPLLQAVLATRPNVGGDSMERLRQLEARQGWRVFQIQDPVARWEYCGNLIVSMHARVAQRAWQLRPAVGWDLVGEIARASIKVPNVGHTLAIGISALFSDGVEEADTLLEAIGRVWSTPGQSLETRSLYDLIDALNVNGIIIPQCMLNMLLDRLYRCDAQSWLAALQLHYISAKTKTIANSSDQYLAAAIEVADFSLAPARATQLANQFKNRPELKQQFVRRLFQALEGKLDWSLNSYLLTWLLLNGGKKAIPSLLPRCPAWLAAHPEDNYFRTHYLGLLKNMVPVQRDAALADTRQWLIAHPEDVTVRTRYLSLMKEMSPAERDAAIADTRQWLVAHPEDASVRACFLGLLSDMNPPERSIAKEDVRTWLATHPDDVFVRLSFLAYLAAFPSECNEEDVENGLVFLSRVPEDVTVRTALVRLLSVRADSRLADVLDRSIDAVGSDIKGLSSASAAAVAASSLSPKDLPVALRWLTWSADTLERLVGQRSAQSVMTSAKKLIGSVERHSRLPDCPLTLRTEAEAALQRIGQAIHAWNRSI